MKIKMTNEEFSEKIEREIREKFSKGGVYHKDNFIKKDVDLSPGTQSKLICKILSSMEKEGLIQDIKSRSCVIEEDEGLLKDLGKAYERVK